MEAQRADLHDAMLELGPRSAGSICSRPSSSASSRGRKLRSLGGRPPLSAAGACGIKKLPCFGGGAIGLTAAFVDSSRVLTSFAEAKVVKKVGVSGAIAATLARRLAQLIPQRNDVDFWLVVETCRQCEQHAMSFRHCEKCYLSRYLKCKATLEHSFPSGLGIELLVPEERRIASNPIGCLDKPEAISDADPDGLYCLDVSSIAAACETPSNVTMKSDYMPGDAKHRPRSAVSRTGTTLRSRGRRCHSATSGGGGAAAVKDEDRSSVNLPKVRPCAFEVYLCGPVSFAPEECIILPRVGGDKPDSMQKSYFALRIASRLETHAWPAISNVIGQVVRAMPRVAMEVRVQTQSEIPVFGASVHAVPRCTSALLDAVDETPICFEGSTGADGVCRLQIPRCLMLVLRVQHDEFLAAQQREVVAAADSAPQIFVADTVVWIGHFEEKTELVVYSWLPYGPYGKLRESFMRNFKPFHGQLEEQSGSVLRPDSDGRIYGQTDLLGGVCRVVCEGWCPVAVAPGSCARPRVDQLTEVARLRRPLLEVSCVARCCGSPLPHAVISIDNEVCGTTNDCGLPVQCHIEHGKHNLMLRHLLVPGGRQSRFRLDRSLQDRISINISPARLQFVCVAGASEVALHAADASPTLRHICADLWLVGGELDSWLDFRLGPRHEGRVQRWNGRLGSGTDTDIATGVSSFVVNDGLLSCCDIGQAESVDFGCRFTSALSTPSSFEEGWSALYTPPPHSACALLRLSQKKSRHAAVWLGHLIETACQSSCCQSELLHPSIELVTECCGCGFPEARITIGAQDVVSDAEDSRAATSHSGSGNDATYKLEIDGVPPCLLPGGVGELVVHRRSVEHANLQLPISCSVFIYWLLPEEDDPADADDDVEDQPLEPLDGTVWVAVHSEHVPDEARALEGIVGLASSHSDAFTMDGSSLGPYPLCRCIVPSASRDPTHCLLGGFELQVQAPAGFHYRAKEPSPLKDRCTELGGCELERLANCPVVVGFLTPCGGCQA